jgi:hypothetical protein
MRKCSYCGKGNNDQFTTCEGCGTPLGVDFSEAQVSKPRNAVEDRSAQGEKLMLHGVLWFVGGGAVTLVSYLAAVNSPGGGHYFIAHGAIIVEIVQFLRGRSMAAGTDGDSRAQELLDTAALFESVDRVKAVALYAEIVSAFPNTRASDEAQRNIQTLTSHKE